MSDKVTRQRWMPEQDTPSHDYYKREGAPEAVDVISGVTDRLGRLGMDGDGIWLAGTALKYALRAGIKTKDPEADYKKCADYLYRLMRGAWPWEVGLGKLSNREDTSRKTML